MPPKFFRQGFRYDFQWTVVWLSFHSNRLVLDSLLNAELISHLRQKLRGYYGTYGTGLTRVLQDIISVYKISKFDLKDAAFYVKFM